MEFLLAAASALWLGILTSISPCPLATNVAAITYIGRRLDHPRDVLLSSLLYAAGRTLTYVVLGALLVYSFMSAPYISHFLQKYMNRILGPLLIVVGMFLLDLIRINFGGSSVVGKAQGKVERLGMWGAGVLGIVFALSFCPVSAVLFFGSLIPLAVKSNSGVLLPAIYGVGTALPVAAFAIAIALGLKTMGKMFASVSAVGRWARVVTGVIFIVIGVYFALAYIFRVIPT